MRKIIAALQVSVDGFIEGPKGELDWIENWEDTFDLLDRVDTCLLGRGMYPDYEQYWQAVLDQPEGPLPFSGKAATKGEIEYADFAARTPHVVLSRTLDWVNWKTTRIARDVEEVRALRQQPGKDMYAVGGATFVSSLMNAGLIDELRLMVQPVLLGGGKALFKGVQERHALQLVDVRRLEPGTLSVTYSTHG